MSELIDVKKLRKKIDLTQSELAQECGVTLRTVQNWEKGETIPESKQKLLQNIAEKYEKNSQKIVGNMNNIQSNNINDTDTIKEIVQILTEKHEREIVAKNEQISKSQEQIDRLISLLEKK